MFLHEDIGDHKLNFKGLEASKFTMSARLLQALDLNLFGHQSEDGNILLLIVLHFHRIHLPVFLCFFLSLLIILIGIFQLSLPLDLSEQVSLNHFHFFWDIGFAKDSRLISHFLGALLPLLFLLFQISSLLLEFEHVFGSPGIHFF